MTYVVMDIETTGLDRYKDKINVVGVYLPQYEIYRYFYESQPLQDFLNTIPEPFFVWQNGKFDTLFLETSWGTPLYPINMDVMILAYCLEMGERKGLKILAQRHLGVPDWDISKKEKLKLSDSLLPYLECDLKYTWQVGCKLMHDAMTHPESERILKLYNGIALPSYLTYRNVERRGIQVDVARLQQMIPEYNARSEALLTKLKQVADINWNSTAQVQEVLIGQMGLPVLKRTQKGVPSIDAEVLKDYAHMGYEIAKLLAEYKRVTKDMGTFLKPWLEKAVNGRLHPTFNVDTVRTGRTSCQDPNLQQVPRDKVLRTLFTARPGYVLFECDYSQVELRIAAHYADEHKMKEIYNNNGDIHHNTATIVTGKENVDKEERRKAKAVNFGFLYGMSAKKFVDYAKTSYGVYVTEAEATEIRNRYFAMYKDLNKWYANQKRLCVRDGGVYTLFGRFRALPEIYSDNYKDKGSAERCSINTPVQSSASDILLSSMIEIDQTLPECWVVGTVHDSVLIEVPANKVEEYKTRIHHIMTHPQLLNYFGIKLSVPLEVDIGVGNWGAKE